MRPLPLLLVVVLAGCDAFGGGVVEIVRYAGDPITEADATVPNDPFPPAGWDGQRLSDVVSVFRTTTCGDECHRTLTLRFEGTGDLPTDVAGTVVTRDVFPERTETETLDIQRVEVQDWGPDVFSGVVHLAPQEDAVQIPLVFWAEDPPFVAPD